ncbi:MAG: TIGR01906 family membrane protein [Tepidiformaceae bacterium]
MTFVSRLATVCFIIAIPLFLITSNIRILATDAAYYRHGFRKYNAAEVTGVPLSDLDRAANEMVGYFEDDSTTLHIIVTEDGQEASLFNAKETAHMEDVKSLMRVVFRANEISLAVIVCYITCVFIWARQKSLRRLAVESLAGVGVGFAVLIAVGIFAVTGFDAAWTRFHEIAFRNDLWELNPATDHLIQMFPEKFWQEATYFVGGLTIAEALVIVITATLYLVLARERRTTPAKTEGAQPVAPAPNSEAAQP